MILTMFFLKIACNESKSYHLASSLQVNNDNTIVLHSNQPRNNIHKQDFPTQDEELVEWARQKFGGVTSFTTIRNLKTMSLTGTNGEHYLCNRVSHIR